MEAMNDKNNPFNQKCQRCCCCCCCPHPYPPPPPPSGLGSFTAVKRDGDTNLPLAGAVYSLYRLNNAEPAATAASDITGALRFTDLEPGEYILSETTAPEGYQSNPETFMVVVDEQGNVTINGEIAAGFSIYDTLAPQPARFLFLKTDGQTGQPLSGAVFRLLSGETATSDDDGVVDFGFLLPGTYTMTEVSPPDGYDPDTEEYTVTVNPDGSIYVNGVPLADFTVANTPSLPLSPTPVIYSITEGDMFILGEGVPGAELVVLLPDGTKVTTTVNENGIWLVPIPSGIVLFAGQTVYAYQTVPGYAPSENASFVVQPRN